MPWRPSANRVFQPGQARLSGKGSELSGRIWGLILLCAFTLAPGPARSEIRPAAAGWTADEAMLLFYEAVVKIREHALEPEPPATIVRQALRAYVRKLDRFSDYLSREEYAAYRGSLGPAFGGVGMELSADATDNIVCVPQLGKAAARAGVRHGDLLKAVDGRAVEGESLYVVGSRIRGRPGTRVKLTVSGADGQLRELVLEREAMQGRSVEELTGRPVPTQRISSFTAQTPRELRESVRSLSAGQPLVIDLRGNSGGDFLAAVEAAQLFLEPGRRVVEVRMARERRSYEAIGTPANTAVRLYLWQDQQTASAAEVFAAALTHNGRAVSLGTKTFGKGLAQRFVELSDGSALLLTYGQLIPPSGVSFHGTGLNPGVLLDEQSGEDGTWYRAVQSLIARRP